MSFVDSIVNTKSSFLSPDGRCYSFDSRASGYGRGEGVAALILKPLHEAIHDGDPIRAVISQTTVNQDGKTPTITSPSQEAQEDLMRLCYKQANLDPGETAYVEAHGTGTKAGDPTEAGAIHAVFCRDRQRPHPLYMGSVKSNIGHLEPASGLAAIIKVALALQKGVIPPSINFEHGNASIPFEQWSLKVRACLLWACLFQFWHSKYNRYHGSLSHGQEILHDVLRSTTLGMVVLMLM
jgi:acyl transferase domain-containing protein